MTIMMCGMHVGWVSSSSSSSPRVRYIARKGSPSLFDELKSKGREHSRHSNLSTPPTTCTMVDDDEVGRIINAMRTTLKGQEGGSMKLKHLIKQVMLLSDDYKKAALKQCIKRRCDLFQVIHHEDGSKIISLAATKPRDSDGNDDLLLSSTDHENDTNKICGDDEVAIINDTSRSLQNDDDAVSNSNKGDDRNSKRKRKRSITSDECTNSSTTTTTLNNSASCLFHGLTMAISTLESKQNEVNNETTFSSNDEYHNYKTLKHILQSHGVAISSQVHKRVHYLIVTDTAVQYLTQRVRQAYKRNVTIVYISWIQECIRLGKLVNVDTHVCNDVVESLINEKKAINGSTDKAVVVVAAAAAAASKMTENTNTTRWSSPILLDCCCACHDENNGDDGHNNCPWCVKKFGAHVDCNIITLEKQKKEGMNKKKCCDENSE